MITASQIKSAFEFMREHSVPTNEMVFMHITPKQCNKILGISPYKNKRQMTKRDKFLAYKYA